MDYSLLVGIHDTTIPSAPDDDCIDSLGEEEGNGYISSDEVVDTPVSPTTGTVNVQVACCEAIIFLLLSVRR